MNAMVKGLMGGTLALAIGIGGAARADDAGHKGQRAAQVSEADRSFLTEAAQGGMAEVELGKLVQDRATREDVRGFGQHMVKDHSKANAELLKIAKRVGVSAPTDIGEGHKSMKEKLTQASGLDFDRQYIGFMIGDHEKDVAAFEREANEGSDPGVKKFAQKTLPTLREHLRMAREINDRVKATQNAQR